MRGASLHPTFPANVLEKNESQQLRVELIRSRTGSIIQAARGQAAGALGDQTPAEFALGLYLGGARMDQKSTWAKSSLSLEGRAPEGERREAMS